MSEFPDSVQKLRRVLLVDRLPTAVTESVLRKYFSKYAALTSVKIVSDPVTGESKGYAYIILEDSTLINHVLSFKHEIWQQPLSLHMPSRKGQRRVWKFDLLHRRLYVSGLPFGTHQHDLVKAFGRYGKVQLAHIITDPEAEKPGTFGYVDFEQEHESLKALGQDIWIKGAKIRVTNMKNPKKPATLSVQCTTQDSRFLAVDPKKNRTKPAKNIQRQHVKADPGKLQFYVPKESRSVLKSEVSNYQCLNLNPMVYVNIVGLVPVLDAFRYAYFDTDFPPEVSKSQILNNDMKLVQLKQSLALTLPKPKPEILTPQKTAKNQRIKFVLAHKLNQEVSNYTFRIEQPQAYLKRTASIFGEVRMARQPSATHRPR